MANIKIRSAGDGYLYLATTSSATDVTVTFPAVSGKAVLDTTVKDFLAPGLVAFFARITPPAGWLECNGAAVSRITYAGLFEAIGTLYGTGDGSTTFNLPDARGEFIRGYDHGRGIDPDTATRTFGSLQLDALQNLTGTLNSNANRGVFGAANSGVFGTPYNTSNMSDGTNTSTCRSVDFNASYVARTSTETRPRNLALLPCIKY